MEWKMVHFSHVFGVPCEEVMLCPSEEVVLCSLNEIGLQDVPLNKIAFPKSKVLTASLDSTDFVKAILFREDEGLSARRD
jgi:hypothetical protein